MGNFVAKTKREVNISAIDFFTIGHLVMGYIAWIIAAIIIFFTPLDDSITLSIADKCLAMACAIVIGIAWEYIENFIFINTKRFASVKFEGREDSLSNSLTDIVGVIGGGAIAWWFSYLPPVVFALISIDLILGLLVLMKKLEKMTK